MSFSRRELLSWMVIMGVVFYHSPFAFSQDSEIRARAAMGESARPAQGRLLLFAFKGAQAKASYPLQINGTPYLTDAEGLLQISLEVGRQHLIFLPQLQRSFTVAVHPELQTQVRIQLEDQVKPVEILEAQWQTADAAQTVSTALPNQTLTILRPNGEPLAQAQVLIGSRPPQWTNPQGQVELEDLRDGLLVTLFHPEYSGETIALSKDSPLPATIKLREALNELEEVIVLAPKVGGSLSALIEVRRQSQQVSDLLSQEQMARAGDSDAASSLRRVTGLTLVDGKYVYVRGLGERYSGVLMNGFSLPSPEPSRRVVPLDLFPTSLLESVVVQKSYSADLPGEFGGGIIQLKSKTPSKEGFVRLNLSNSYEGTSQRYSHLGGSQDWLGMDDGSRALPAPIRETLAQGKQVAKNVPGFDGGLSEEELIRLGRSLNNNYRIQRTDEMQMPGINLSLGQRYRLGQSFLSVSAGGLYGQTAEQIQRRITSLNVGSGGRLTKELDRQGEFGEMETRLAGTTDLKWEYADQSVQLSSYVLRNTTSRTQFDETIYYSRNGNVVESTLLDWIERELWTNQLAGEHGLSGLTGLPLQMDWRLSLSRARRDNPDRRDYAYDVSGGNRTIANDSSGNTRTFSELLDQSWQQGVDWTLPVRLWRKDQVKLKWGGSALQKERRSDVNRFFFANDFNGAPPVDLQDSIETLFNPDNRRPGVFLLRNITNDADTYTGEQNLVASYAMATVDLSSQWTGQAGWRFEDSRQTVRTFRYFEPDSPFATSEQRMQDLLPAYSLTWKPSPQWRARLAYSETLARPDFRELSTVGFIDDETGYQVQGNPNLRGTVIENIDHRWEFYFSQDEFASIGVFYKKFRSPIEVMFIPGVNNIQSFENAESATNYGAEIEGRLSLRHLSRNLRRWTVQSNLTLIESQIRLDARNLGIQTSGQRPLQGQSPYVVNVQLQYDRPVWGTSTNLLYNIVGSRITEVGTNQVPDTYEQAYGQLDFVWNQKIDSSMSLSFRARNLLDPLVESTQNGQEVRAFRRGRSLGLAMGVNF